jgi:hydroxyethylthiazole kinase-like uncharacterized protein yjeF
MHGVAASRQIEREAQVALPPFTLMRRAGLAAARCALAVTPHARRIWVAAGPGNNGGDGLQAAAALHQAGKQVQVSLLGDPARLPPDAADALAAAQQAGVPIGHEAAPPWPSDLAIDALLGLGASRAPAGRLAEAVQALNRLDAPVLALDLPTGLDAERGQPLGEPCVRATHTLSLLTLKPGLFTAAGRDLAGSVWFDPLQVETTVAPDAWLAGESACAPWRRPRAHDRHKGSFGDVLVVGGAAGMSGAAWLAARAALRAGAGRVYVDPLDGHAPGVPSWPELMCRPGAAAHDDAMLRHATVVCGCGGGDAVAAVLPTVLRGAVRLVLDADGLNAIAAEPALLAELKARAGRQQATLLTPHPLEAARLLGSDAAGVQHDRLAAGRALAARCASAVLLKGAGTVCAEAGTPPIINPTGNALLATAGTGDVLAGWAGGWWAQRANASPFELATAAAWWHGHAADHAAAAGRHAPLVAGALIDAMAAPL